MLWKCCTHYASKSGKLSSGHRTEKGKFLFQFQRRAMPKNVSTTLWLCSFHMLVRLCSKSFKLGFSRMWTVNFQMHRLGLKRQKNQRSHCQHSLDHRESNGIAENIYFCFTDYMKSFVWIPTKCGKLLKRWEYLIILPISWEIYMWVKKQQLEQDME